MNEYFNPEAIDWPGFALGGVVGLLVMVGVSYMGSGVVAIAAGIPVAVVSYGKAVAPRGREGRP